MRDARAVVLKVKDVLWPTKSFSENDAVTKDWDLWGPLVFCLVLSLLLSFGASDNQSQIVFTGIFTMVWLGEAICTLNLKLLGGTVYDTLFLTQSTVFLQLLTVMGQEFFSECVCF